MMDVGSLMSRQFSIINDPERCQACPDCLAAHSCKVRAIRRIDSDEAPFLEAGRCCGCRVCIPACPHGAISLAASV